MLERAFPRGRITCTSESCKASLLVGSRIEDQEKTMQAHGWIMMYDPEFERLMPFCKRCC